jgi:hypothetical protein
MWGSLDSKFIGQNYHGGPAVEKRDKRTKTAFDKKSSEITVFHDFWEKGLKTSIEGGVVNRYCCRQYWGYYCLSAGTFGDQQMTSSSWSKMTTCTVTLHCASGHDDHLLQVVG